MTDIHDLNAAAATSILLSDTPNVTAINHTVNAIDEMTQFTAENSETVKFTNADTNVFSDTSTQSAKGSYAESEGSGAKVHNSLIGQSKFHSDSQTHDPKNYSVVNDYRIVADPLNPPVRFDHSEDLELTSHFIEQKKQIANSFESYISDHPELQDILADYIRTVLHRKPDDVYKFTKEFFE
ncbi:hypothetical protein BKA69DRAFT_1123430 [Paraphysoderma sedebokerense]|nr:hypothetical protein BKA69DRAFT_1123430 [Paraphysoderma sedebokerense]